jgi:O-antigen ligase
MRVYLIWIVVFFLSIYSIRNWYMGACSLVVMMAITGRPDMPSTVLGIPGFNPWNMLFLFVVLSWMFNSKDESINTLSRTPRLLFYFFVAISLIATFRGFSDTENLKLYHELLGWKFSFKTMVIDDLVNTYKYLFLGMLFYYGATTEKNIKIAIYSVLLLNLLLSIQVIKWMPLSALVDGELLQKRSMRVIDRQIGYYRSDLAVLLGSAAWAFFSARKMNKSKLQSLFWIFCSLLGTVATFLTGSRIGMGSWISVSMLLSWFRWRQLYIVAPVLMYIVFTSIPAVKDRMMQGFEQSDSETVDYAEIEGQEGDINTATVTSGRTLIWPYVIKKIGERPILGYGRHGMRNSGLTNYLLLEHNELFPHPHNAFLELILDNGIILSIPILYFFYYIILKSIRLIKDENEIAILIGSITLSFTFGQLIGCIGGQSLYPMESQVSMWVMIFVLLRYITPSNEMNNKPESVSANAISNRYYQ